MHRHPHPYEIRDVQTAQHATMAANIFAKKDQLGLRKLQLSFRLRRDKRLTEIAHAKKAARMH